MPNWKTLSSTQQVDDLINKESNDAVCVILKHSTTCPLSSIAKLRLEGDGDSLGDHVKWYYLDLLANRSLSAYIADKLSVHHESPQVIVIKNGEATYDVSHLDITIDDLSSEVVPA